MLSKKIIDCDFCVVGGGMSGLCAAISAAREGLKVVLMHERPVLGGNASSEIRMWICGALGSNNRETGIIEEIALENLYRNPTKSYAIWDSILYDFVRRENNIQLLLNCTCMDADTEKGEYSYGRDVRITSVTGYQMTTQRFYEVHAKYYCDSSGDSILAPLSGAQYRLGREASCEFGEDTATTVADDNTMGMSCLIQGRETCQNIKFIPPEWRTKLNDSDFKNREPKINNDLENFWYLELGGNQDTIGDTEELRDQLVPLALGTWDYVKNSGKFNTDTWDLEFLGFLPGKRESRRMCGEYMITQRDISDGTVFDDEVAYGGWPLDDHFPGGFYHRGAPNTNIPTPAPYSIPYRSLYSKNVENLFFAGRNISMTHMAMSSIRVMATCSILGEAVGKAAYLAVTNNCTPHDVYRDKLEALQTLLLNSDCFLPSKKRSISSACKEATLICATNVIRNGEDRPHKIYGTDDASGCLRVMPNTEITYEFKMTYVSTVHIVFSSDLDRKTLPGASETERMKSTRSNYRLDHPLQHLPTPLCKEFVLRGEYEGETVELLHVQNNRKRCYHINVGRQLDKLVLIPLSSWGDKDISLISFDFS